MGYIGVDCAGVDPVRTPLPFPLPLPLPLTVLTRHGRAGARLDVAVVYWYSECMKARTQAISLRMPPSPFHFW